MVPIASTSIPVLLTALRVGYTAVDGSSVTCDGAVMQFVDWDINRDVATVNPNCDLHMSGEPIRVISGSW